ncbi:MAG: SDR family NAD(P)-dependent oxidoreductase, partial [Nevskiales bacterium]
MANAALKGKTALVTGASSGLGVDFARELAAQGCNLVLVARREELLKQVQTELLQCGIKVAIVTLDLGTSEAPQALYDLVRLQGLAVDVLVNNAGFGLFGKDLDLPWPKTRQMLQLNMLALTELTRLFARDMVKRGNGHILQIASTGAYQP